MKSPTSVAHTNQYAVNITDEASFPSVAGQVDFELFDPNRSIPYYVVISKNLIGTSGSKLAERAYTSTLKEFTIAISNDLSKPMDSGAYMVINTERRLNVGTGEKE